MKVLVTGAGGMVGSHLVEMLHEKGYNVIGTYYKPTTDLREISQDIRLMECDVRYPSSLEKIILDFMPEKVFHLAAQSYPTVSWDRPYETIDTNINGTIAVFESIKKARNLIDKNYDPIVVVACSSAEYGETLNMLSGDSILVKESDPLLPLHPYGVSKVGQDLLSFQYFMNDHIKCIRARIFNTTGTRKTNDVTSDFTFRAIQAIKTKKYEIKVGNLKTKRAIMDQRDLNNALILLSDKGKYGDVYNISSEHVYETRGILSIIEKNIGVELTPVVDKALLRPTDEKIIVGDITKLKKDTGWNQMVTMEETINDMLQYWRKKLL